MSVTRSLTALVIGGEAIDGPGGSEAVCRAQVQALRRLGIEPSYLAAGETWRASRLGRLPMERAWGSIGAGFACQRYVAEEYDIVVSNGPFGIGVRGRLASIHMYHGTYVGQAEAVRPFISNRGFAKMRYADGLVVERLAGKNKRCLANSRMTAAEVGQWLGHSCEVVWCPVDVDRFRPSDPGTGPSEDLGLETGSDPTILFVGWGRATKGSPQVADAIRDLEDVNWVLIGDGRLPSAQVRRLRSVEPDAMPDLLRSTDLVLIPSRYESFGVLGAEALATGVPLVLGRSGLRDFINERAKRLPYVPARHGGSLVGPIREALARHDDLRSAALEFRGEIVRSLGTLAWGDRFLESAGLTSA